MGISERPDIEIITEMTHGARADVNVHVIAWLRDKAPDVSIGDAFALVREIGDMMDVNIREAWQRSKMFERDLRERELLLKETFADQ